MMDRSALLQIVREIFEDSQGEAIEGFDESASLQEELGLDSVDMLTTVMAIQDRFRLVLESDDLEAIETVSDFLDLLQSKLPTGASQAA